MYKKLLILKLSLNKLNFNKITLNHLINWINTNNYINFTTKDNFTLKINYEKFKSVIKMLKNYINNVSTINY